MPMRFRVPLRRSAGAAATFALAASLLTMTGCTKPAAPSAPPPPVVGVVRVAADERAGPGHAERDDPGAGGGHAPGPGPRVPHRAALRGRGHRQEGPAPARHRRGAVQGRPAVGPGQAGGGRGGAQEGRGSPRRARSPRRSWRSTRRSCSSPRSRSGGAGRCWPATPARARTWTRPRPSARSGRPRSRPTAPTSSRPRPTTTSGSPRPQAQVEAAKAAVRDAELNLGYCRMYAPIDGRIGEAKVKVGNLVGPDPPAAGAFTELATIQQLDPMGVDIRAQLALPRPRHPADREGLPVRLTRPGLEGDREHPEAGSATSSTTRSTRRPPRSWPRPRIPNPAGTLLPGEYVKLRIVVDRIEDAVVVPEPAVMETEAGPVVYIVDGEGKVAIQRVEAAQTYEGLRVITKGLDAGRAGDRRGAADGPAGHRGQDRARPRPRRGRVPRGGERPPAASPRVGPDRRVRRADPAGTPRSR